MDTIQIMIAEARTEFRMRMKFMLWLTKESFKKREASANYRRVHQAQSKRVPIRLMRP